ncbi:MAG: HAMP domain-containing histidine kinase [Leptolyngbyaceae cyanobacterium SL_1_1]|nr:HAMP domain-containing histidine kinase [Leptolyngbyaceae cyanobacterium SL_1_1]
MSQPKPLRQDGGTNRSAASARQQGLQAEAEWQGAIAACNQLLQTAVTDAATATAVADGSQPLEGIVLSGPLPVINQPNLASQFSTWIFNAHLLEHLALPSHLLPANLSCLPLANASQMLPLVPGDPLGQERFCLVLTARFSLILVLGQDASGLPKFRFSFTPEIVNQAYQLLRSRVLLVRPHCLDRLQVLTEKFPVVEPSYQTVTRFSRYLLAHQSEAQLTNLLVSVSPSVSPSIDVATNLSATTSVDPQTQHFSESVLPETRLQFVTTAAGDAAATSLSPDAELLQAMAHEICTPLSTIRTLVRSLLRRPDLDTDVAKRLRSIDRECTQQIDRFNLIFKAVELETEVSKQPKSPLTPIALSQIFQESIPHWQQQASRRSLTLEVLLPPKLPMVASDPTMLKQVLTGLVERFTNSLPCESHLQLCVMLAGHQLKLQFKSTLQAEDTPSVETCKAKPAARHSPLRSVGQLLMFQPETGGLTLNLNVTKNLFQALGGKLIVRQRPQQGEIVTVFLPLEGQAVKER